MIPIILGINKVLSRSNDVRVEWRKARMTTEKVASLDDPVCGWTSGIKINDTAAGRRCSVRSMFSRT